MYHWPLRYRQPVVYIRDNRTMVARTIFWICTGIVRRRATKESPQRTAAMDTRNPGRKEIWNEANENANFVEGTRSSGRWVPGRISADRRIGVSLTHQAMNQIERKTAAESQQNVKYIYIFYCQRNVRSFTRIPYSLVRVRIRRSIKKSFLRGTNASNTTNECAQNDNKMDQCINSRFPDPEK